jgi:hypothetical protein
VLGPTAKRIEAVGPESAEGQRLIRRVFALLRVDLLFLFAIVFAMTVKPTGDDVWGDRRRRRHSRRGERRLPARDAQGGRAGGVATPTG